MRSRPTRSARSFRTNSIIAAIIPAVLVLAQRHRIRVGSKAGHGRRRRSGHAREHPGHDVAGVLRQTHVSLSKGDVLAPRGDAEVTDGMTVVVRHAIPVTVRVGDVETPYRRGRAPPSPTRSRRLAPRSHRMPRSRLRSTPNSSPAWSSQLRSASPGSRRTNVVVPFKTETFVGLLASQGHAPDHRRRLQAASRCRSPRRSWPTASKAHPRSPPRRSLRGQSPQLEAVGPVGPGRTGRGQDSSPPSDPADRRSPRPAAGCVCSSTAYSPNEPGGGGGPSTAMGHPAVFGVVAVDPRVIPLGTRVYVVGYGYAMAYDTGGDIKGDRIDLCFDTGGECERWGRQAGHRHRPRLAWRTLGSPPPRRRSRS